jgi:putative membrane protein
MTHLILRILVNGIALVLTAYFLPGMRAEGGIGTVIILGIIFGLVNGLIRPVLKFITFPLIIVTLGLFILVINALMLLLVGWLSGGRLVIDGFWTAVLGGIVMGVINMILEAVTGMNSKEA